MLNLRKHTNHDKKKAADPEDGGTTILRDVVTIYQLTSQQKKTVILRLDCSD